MFCFVGFGTDRLRHEEAMKTAGRENPKPRGSQAPATEHMARQVRTNLGSIKWAEKQEKFQPLQKCFFLDFSFIEAVSMGRRNISSKSTYETLER